jgi:hypothetical protein
MNTPSQWAARPAIRFAGLAAGLAFLLGACGESVPEGEKTGSATPPAATDQAATEQATPTTEDAAKTASQ